MPPSLRASFIAAFALLGVVAFATGARSATDTPTSVELTQDPGYVYLNDAVTLIATVSPNPGSGVVEFSYGGQIREVVPVEADGTAAHVTSASPTGNGDMLVRAEFYATAGFAGSFDFLIVDLRSLPNIAIPNPPLATQSSSASISFVTGNGVSPQCRLDGGSWAGCTSPWTASSLAEGLHTFEARGTLGDGRYGPPAAATWAVDQTPPVHGTLTLDGGVPSTNHSVLLLSHPATDSLSGVAWVRVSRTGQLDDDGNLWLDEGLQDSYARRWDQVTGQRHDWSVYLEESGPQTAWVQWFDAAGNGSEIESVSVDVRVATPRLGGLWSTTDDVVPFSITGIGANEIQAIKIATGPGNLDWGLDDATLFQAVPSTWDVSAPPGEGGFAGRLRVVAVQWQDTLDQWSDVRAVPIALLDAQLPDVALDEGASVTPDPVVQAALSPSNVLRWNTDLIQIQYSCDGSSWTGGWWQGGYLPVHVDRGETGCPSGNGWRTLSFRWAWGVGFGCCKWSDVRQVSINLQRDPSLPPDDDQAPDGSVGLSGGASAVTTPAITLATPATDGATGVTNVRLSNDGTNWTTREYGATQAWTLPPGSGSRKIWAQWQDGARNWSNPISTTIVLDTANPTATAPKLAFASATATLRGSVPLRLTWTGSDGGSGVEHYDVALSTDGGPYAALGSVTSPTVTRFVGGGHSYRFRIRPVDHAGNVGSWVDAPTVRRSIIDDEAVSYSGTWATRACGECIGGTQRVSRDGGAVARATITGRAAAYIATVGQGYGRAKVIVDGVRVATIDLASSLVVSRKLIWSIRWSSVGTHAIRIKVVGPEGGPRTTLDALAIIR